MKLATIMGIVAKVLFVIFAIIFIIQITLKLTGHSPTEMQLLYIAISGIVTYLFAASYHMGVFIGQTREFMHTTRDFMHTTRDFMSTTRDFMNTTQNNFAKLMEDKKKK